jgi:dephospho-CoA kinase
VKRKSPFLIGLTGGPGAGKSTVAELLKAKGAGVICGDELGRRVLRRFPEIREALRHRYGDAIFTASGRLRRRDLGRFVFAQKGEAAWLNALMFPKIHELLQQDIRRLSRDHSVIVIDAAMILEWGIESEFDRIWVVVVSRKIAEARMAGSGRLSPEEVRSRLQAQIPPEEKARRAHRIIRNNGKKRELREAIAQIWKNEVIPRLAQKIGD